MLNSRFGYSMKKNSFKGLNIDCIQYSNTIRITYYSHPYSGTILNPNIILIRIRPNICARILFVFVFAHSEKTNIIRICIRSKFWFWILFVFGPQNSIRSPLNKDYGNVKSNLSRSRPGPFRACRVQHKHGFCHKWHLCKMFFGWGKIFKKIHEKNYQFDRICQIQFRVFTK